MVDDGDGNVRWVKTVHQQMTLKELRKQAGLSQTALASLTHLSHNRISEIEKAGLNQSIASIITHVEALGGRLKLMVEFEDRSQVEIINPQAKER